MISEREPVSAMTAAEISRTGEWKCSVYVQLRHNALCLWIEYTKSMHNISVQHASMQMFHVWTRF